MNSDTVKGASAAFGAFFMWGFLPVYWKVLGSVPAFEILCHRMVWSLVMMAMLVIASGRYKSLVQALENKNECKLITTTAVLLSGNWLLYIWAVNSGYIIEASLGYFINPLLNILLGMIFFKERMRPLQYVSIGIVLVGVIYLTVFYGKFPWIAFGLATCFAIYGVLHKKTSLGALDGLCIETAILFLPAAAILGYLYFTGEGSFGNTDRVTDVLLVGAGAVTTIPLLLFGFAAHKVRLSTLGLLQYLAPTISLLLGIWVYHEGFPFHRMVGFCIIWTALAIFLIENIANHLRYSKR